MISTNSVAKRTLSLLTASALSLAVFAPDANAQNYNNPFPNQSKYPSRNPDPFKECAHRPRTCKLPDGISRYGNNTREQQDAWNKCLVSVALAGIPAAKAAKTVVQAIRSGTAATLGGAYIGCDFDAIQGK